MYCNETSPILFLFLFQFIEVGVPPSLFLGLQAHYYAHIAKFCQGAADGLDRYLLFCVLAYVFYR
ncbi:hypothetical protein CEE36_04095 [candidate division TA06 bacterium B3_TA06]|uniref:Uncharacterized protein n=1 Tax=candidate division TA06 bacterium B3_TA06 TaxID=2012487 RepID=A0A532V8Q9_UNCT6|nr:MAG: hypothetical protein CEE36_04095 [candidate division TA06 bacterium B3_TA06]